MGMDSDLSGIKPEPPPIVKDGQVSVTKEAMETVREVGGKVEAVSCVLEDLALRRHAGIKKYGTELTTFNGRDALVDAYQEALDLLVYSQQAATESEDPAIEEMVRRTSLVALDIRCLLNERKKA